MSLTSYQTAPPRNCRFIIPRRERQVQGARTFFPTPGVGSRGNDDLGGYETGCSRGLTPGYSLEANRDPFRPNGLGIRSARDLRHSVPEVSALRILMKKIN